MKKNVQPEFSNDEFSDEINVDASSAKAKAPRKKTTSVSRTRTVKKSVKTSALAENGAEETTEPLIEERDAAPEVKRVERKRRLSSKSKTNAAVEAVDEADPSKVEGKKKVRQKRTSKKESVEPTDSKNEADTTEVVKTTRARRSKKSLAKDQTPVEEKSSDVPSSPQCAEKLRIIRAWEETKKKIASIPLSSEEQERRAKNARLNDSRLFADSYYDPELPFWAPGWIRVLGARQHNLKSLNVSFPVSAFSVVTGVSGSGKSSLVEDVLYRSLSRILNRSQAPLSACDSVTGCDRINKVIRVDQAPIGQTPSSNAATHTGAFELIRELFAQTQDAKIRGFTPRHFSFNVPGGRCEKCEGAGVIKVEMHFLADLWITCDACGGKRYSAETLRVKYRGKSIADVLDTTCGDALRFFGDTPALARILQTLCDVGLDYLPLGQSATTLSGGEAQRVKLATELSRIDSGRTLYILDEPTTGLHFEDVKKLLYVLHRLVDLGNTVVVVEHNLDVVKNADWIIELGPEAGLDGGQLVFAGTPEQLLDYSVRRLVSPEAEKSTPRSYTGEALLPVFENGTFAERPVLDANAYWERVKKITPLIPKDSDDDQTVDSVSSPWEIDGRRWHTEFRTSRGGETCHWEGKCLSAIVDRLENSGAFAETNWNSRTFVEIRSARRNTLCFMRATTNEEWLLKLKFRTAKNTFSRDLLLRKLDLRPLNEIDEIPLYGTQPRVKLDSVGAWQEIELKVFSFAEIDREEFWNFLDLAVERFVEAVDSGFAVEEEDILPNKTGRDWHLTPSGCYGKSDKPLWDVSLLLKLVDLIETLSGDDSGRWDKSTFVPFYLKGIKYPWAQIYTKNCEFLSLQANLPKGSVMETIGDFPFEYELDESVEEFDSVYFQIKDAVFFEQDRINRFLQTVRERNLNELE